VQDVLEQHLDPDQAQKNGQRDLQVVELLHDPGQREIERAQTEDREDVAGEDEERIGGDGEDGRDGIDGEHDIGAFHHDERERERRQVLLPAAIGQKVMAVELVRNPKMPACEADDRVVPGIGLLLVQEHSNGGEDQEGAEDVQHPVESLDEDGPQPDHQAAHDQRAEDSPEENAMLVLRRNVEKREDHGDDEEVVHAQRRGAPRECGRRAPCGERRKGREEGARPPARRTATSGTHAKRGADQELRQREGHMRSESVPKSIDDYIAGFPKDVQVVLKKIRKTIRKVAPEAEESISYRIPTYKLAGRAAVYFAGFNAHVSIYPVTADLRERVKQLARYEGGKGTARFPLDEPIPYALIERVVKAMVSAKRKKAKSAGRGRSGSSRASSRP
jgi:uncharacterized protein YdhG (YjbR/CyaY superfamily)